jgi:dihydrofolate synthase/folylpolyglutamate synthase
VEPGLGRITGLLEMMGHPEDGYPIVHIAGTNGKTSTARIATMLCVAHGLTTGTFISPHLERVEERIAINGQTASPEQFVRAVADVAAFASIFEERTGESLTYFELTAAMAFAWFADEAVDAAVVEVGLGGRLDATNAARGDVAVLTGVAIDHTEYLGTTVEQIAAEKLAIVKPRSVLVTGPLQPAVATLAEEVALRQDARLLRYGVDFSIESARPAVGGWQVDLSGTHESYRDVFLPLHGRHQTVNLAVAIAAIEALLGRALDPQAVVDGVSAVHSPGRMEPVSADPLVLLDGAHNVDGFTALAEALAEEFPHVGWVAVIGVMADKDVDAMLPALARRVTAVVATAGPSPRALPAGDLADRARTALGVPVEVVEEPVAAVEHARRLAGPDGAVLVTGSLYLVGAARSHLLGHGPIQRNER